MFNYRHPGPRRVARGLRPASCAPFLRASSGDLRASSGDLRASSGDLRASSASLLASSASLLASSASLLASLSGKKNRRRQLRGEFPTFKEKGVIFLGKKTAGGSCGGSSLLLKKASPYGGEIISQNKQVHTAGT